MADDKDYSFILSPGGKTRYIAGPFDAKTHKPHYEIDVSVPTHVRNRVEIQQFFVGPPENYQWGWDIKNRSTWPAFVTIKKDGETIKFP
jgi:hypothetical protein